MTTGSTAVSAKTTTATVVAAKITTRTIATGTTAVAA